MNFTMGYRFFVVALFLLSIPASVISEDASDRGATGLLTPVHDFGLRLVVDPSGKAIRPAPGEVIFKPRLTRDNGRVLTDAEMTKVKYTSLDLPEWLELDSKTGEVRVRDVVIPLPTAKNEALADGVPPPPHVVGTTFKFNLTAADNASPRVPPERQWARPVMAAPGSARVYVHINVTVQDNSSDNEKSCDEICKKEGACSEQCIRDSCFWHRAEYQLWENQPAFQLGTLGPGNKDSSDCRSTLKYSLDNGTNYAKVSKNEKTADWWLWTRENLDRDLVSNNGSGPGPFLRVRVRCETQCKSALPVETVLQITVLDEDDNQPVSQAGPNIRCDITGTGKKRVCAGMIIDDLDSKSANKYDFKVIDPSKKVRLDTRHVFAVNYRGFPSTAMRFDLVLEGPSNAVHRFQFIVNDTTLGYNKEKALVINLSLNDNQTEIQGDQPPTPAAVDNGSPGSTLRVSRDVAQVPAYRSATVKRSASLYTRIAQPVSPVADMSFEMGQEGLKTGLNVTATEGIVYVSDPAKLRKSDDQVIRVDVLWKKPEGSQKISSFNLTINGSRSPEQKCKARKQEYEAVHVCSQAWTSAVCHGGCVPGFGDDHIGATDNCTWVGPFHTAIFGNWSTCVARQDEKFCPDKRCDSLEKMNLTICPQDCVPKGNIWPPHTASSLNPLGIQRANGSCSCSFQEIEDELEEKSLKVKCSCGFPPNKNSTRKDQDKLKRKNTITVGLPNKTNAGSHVMCDDGCVFLFVGCTAVVVSSIALLLYWRRYRRRPCLKKKPVSVHNGTSSPAITGEQSVALRDGITAKPGPIDPKWEFPRNRLVIEKVLGEGEFGRVLRAKALDIAGSRGYTTVAVKTLKDDACQPEALALLSEYALLKDVSHPNVIRLLGACTRGGPIYIIIEYAEHGSLLSFLRKRRRRKRTDPSVNPEAAVLTPITPKDVIAFAWQVAKGMAYLSDLKLVHRDLAARNVLVASGNICKISDFGLTRDVYEDDAYLKKSKGRVPVKWMAPESLADRVYTTKSDVWSYGVLLWELATHGATPYPGTPVHNLYYLLRSGYRLDIPKNCSEQLYSIMRQCWNDDPSARPSFHQLEKTFEEMVGDGVEYLEIIQDAVINPSYFIDRIDNLTGKPPVPTPPDSSTASSAATSPQRSPLNGPRQCCHDAAGGYEVPATATCHCDVVVATDLSGDRPRSYLDMIGVEGDGGPILSGLPITSEVTQVSRL